MRVHLKRKSSALLPIFSFLAISAVIFSLSACVVTADRGPYPTQEPYPRPGEFQRVQGLWLITAAGNQPGKLELYWDGHRWAGRIWYDSQQQWEELTDIFFNPRAGELQFLRPRFNSQYTGTLSDHQILGTFTYAGSVYSWVGKRGEPLDLRRVQGVWFVIAAGNQPGKLEFYREGQRWAGRIWYDSQQQWEELTDISFNPRTGELQFLRPRFNSPYTGTLSDHQILGTFTYAGSVYSWVGKREEPVDLRRVQGVWFVIAAGNQPGKLEFYREGQRWAGRIWYDSQQQWEELTDISFNPRTGELQFLRPRFNSQYTGTLSRNQIVGTFVYEGRTYPWDARRQ